MVIEDIVAVLIKQHRDIQKDANKILGYFETDSSVNADKIHDCLDKFSVDLTEHLKFENDVFYTELLKRMEEKAVNTGSTRKFILQMKSIEKVINTFLDSFKTKEDIQKRIKKFHERFEDINNLLNLRIESEEEGVYTYWDMYTPDE